MVQKITNKVQQVLSCEHTDVVIQSLTNELDDTVDHKAIGAFVVLIRYLQLVVAHQEPYPLICLKPKLLLLVKVKELTQMLILIECPHII